MRTEQLELAAKNALSEAGVLADGPGLLLMSECQFYASVRILMHKMDADTSRWDIRRYGFKAVAGAMTKLMSLRCE